MAWIIHVVCRSKHFLLIFVELLTIIVETLYITYEVKGYRVQWLRSKINKKKNVFSTTVCYILSPNVSDPMAYWDRHLYNIESPFNKESSYQIQVHCNSWVYGILFLNYCVLLNLWFGPNGSYPINPLVFICAYFKICISQWIFMHMEYISLLIRYSRACGFCQDFRDRGLLLTRKLLNQGLLLVSWNYHFESFTVAIGNTFVRRV
jgi:hypothetical protein